MKRVIKHASWIILLLIGAINLARGLTHFIARDSAAGAAGISIDHAGGADIVYLFAIIGGVQIVLALFYVYVAVFIRKIVPLALTMEGLKTGVNLWIGYDFKPSQAEMVVGGTQDQLQLALSILALALLVSTKSLRKITAGVLSLCVVLVMLPGFMPQAGAAPETDLWDGTVAAGFADGNGTFLNPYKIATGAQLAYLAGRVNAGNPYANTYFALAADIDLGGREWTPIGGFNDGFNYFFRGIFDGKGHVVSRLAITANLEEAGLFGKVQDATIRNVGLEDVDIAMEETTLTGGLVGNVFNKSSGTSIENVYVTGEIATGINVHAGGLVGRSSGPAVGNIKTSYSTVSVTAGLQGAKVGGLVGTTIRTNIVNSYAAGHLAGGGDKQRIGGLVGYTQSSIGGISYWNSDAIHMWKGNSLADKWGVAYSTEPDYPANADGSTASNDMKLAAFVTALNDDPDRAGVWKLSAGKNDGYPVIDGVGAGRGPMITSEPVHATVDEGGSTTFAVTATHAASYQWQVDQGSGFANVGDIPPYSGSTTSTLTIAGAAGDMNGYTYRVVIGDASSYTATSSEAVLTVNAIPAAPTIIHIVAGDSAASLSWNLVSGATGYNVYRRAASDSYGAEALSVGEAVYMADIAALTNGVTYYFVVTALNGGLESAYSNEVSATPQVDAPGAPAIQSVVAGDGQVALEWSAVAGASGYKVYQRESSGTYGAELDTVTGSVYSYTATELTNGTTYYFMVRATNPGGDSADSNEAGATPVAVTPRAPASDDDDDDSGLPEQPETEQAAGSAVIILVNGKEEDAGTAATEEVNGRQVTTVALDEEKLQRRLEAEGKQAVIAIPVAAGSDVVIGELNGRMVKNMENEQAVLEIRTERATYTLPAQLINIDAVSARFGANLALQDIIVQIEIAAPSSEMSRVVEEAARREGFTPIVDPIHFKVSVVYGDRTEEIARFNAYVQRTVAIPEGVDPARVTTGAVIEPDGTVRHVPTKVVELGGRYYAQINSLTNSAYSLVWHPLAFKDVAGHWAKDAVNDMGSRMVVSGTGGGMFSPDRHITRAEFAAILTGGLGLRPENGQSGFTDVKATSVFIGAIQTAYEHGLISGYADGAFRPGDKITREQAMQMIAGAMKITGLNPQLQGQSAAAALRRYQDAEEISPWALRGVAESVQAGIVTGRGSAELAPKAFMTRAEVAIIVKRLLEISGLI